MHQLRRQAEQAHHLISHVRQRNGKCDSGSKRTEQHQKVLLLIKKTINTSDISISLDPDQGAVNKISVTVAGFPADAEGQVTLQYSYQGSIYENCV